MRKEDAAFDLDPSFFIYDQLVTIVDLAIQ